ncbi:hypothetical protein LZ30DRAFT_716732 [Colletotrichum cereale]|nr:hypothetical protein LZ30DRAFT_716732 [Colletotrichum cereale]
MHPGAILEVFKFPFHPECYLTRNFLAKEASRTSPVVDLVDDCEPILFQYSHRSQDTLAE